MGGVRVRVRLYYIKTTVCFHLTVYTNKSPIYTFNGFLLGVVLGKVRDWILVKLRVDFKGFG